MLAFLTAGAVIDASLFGAGLCLPSHIEGKLVQRRGRTQTSIRRMSTSNNLVYTMFFASMTILPRGQTHGNGPGRITCLDNE